MNTSMTPRALTSYRRRRGLTQQALAARLGVARNTVTRWEMGLHPIPRWAVRFLTVLQTHTLEGPISP